MKQIELTSTQQSVIEALENEHLTSFQILKKVDNISLILVLYNIMDELKGMGILKSYTEENKTYHYSC